MQPKHSGYPTKQPGFFRQIRSALTLERERQHNREKDRQLLDTLSKLAESQAALVAGQTAEKQKQLAETIIEGAQRMDGGADRAEPEPQQPQPEPPRSWWSRFWEK